MVNVLVVDDQVIVREGLANLFSFSEQINVVDTTCSGERAIEILDESKHDVILMDIQMRPGMTGIETVSKLRELGHDTPVLILTTFEGREVMLEAVKAGANGYLLKDAELEDLEAAILTVLKGGSVINPLAKAKASKESLEQAGNISQSCFIEPLTEQEKSVLRLLVAGFSNRQIAESMYKSEGTIKNYITNIMGKLGVRDRTQAALLAVAHSLV